MTAAAGGIGSALVDVLAGAGARIMAVDISARRLDGLAETWAAKWGGHVVTRRADLGVESEVEGAVDAAAELFGGLDGLANVAGGIPGFSAESFDLAIGAFDLVTWRKYFTLNVETAFVAIRRAVPVFERVAYGKVVNVASMAAYGNHDQMGNTAYDTAKSAVLGMTTSLARTLGPLGVRVNAVSPGTTLSPMMRESFDHRQLMEYEMRAPLRAVGKPSDVAGAMAYLLAPESDHVTGETIRVSGGLR
ncbi:SDR family NAD(P)-dependent oxidoreductase [Pseudonocardia oroxyli]|nr:SDR family oxidoreductase [Pseudonocardia oroxyli]